MLNREIKKKYLKNRIKRDLGQPMLTFKTHDLSHEVGTKPIKKKKKDRKNLNKKLLRGEIEKKIQ
jgi:hypothetical protein